MCLILVRHARPAHVPHRPPHEWELGMEGQRAARSLRDVLPPDALLVSSPEPKARQTLAACGEVVVDHRVAEVARNEPYDGDFRGRRLAYVTGTDHAGWEPRAEVIARFDASIRQMLGYAFGRPFVVATHGMAMTLWLSTMGVADPGAFWSDLRLPDLIAVNPLTHTVGRILSTQLFR